MFGPFGLHLSSNPCRWLSLVTNSSGQRKVQHCPRSLGTYDFYKFKPRATARLEPRFSTNQKNGNSCCGPVLDAQNNSALIMNLIKIEHQQILNYSWISHKYNSPSTTYFKTEKIWEQHELLRTDSPSRPQCWQSAAGPKWTQPKRYM